MKPLETLTGGHPLLGIDLRVPERFFVNSGQGISRETVRAVYGQVENHGSIPLALLETKFGASIQRSVNGHGDVVAGRISIRQEVERLLLQEDREWTKSHLKRAANRILRSLRDDGRLASRGQVTYVRGAVLRAFVENRPGRGRPRKKPKGD